MSTESEFWENKLSNYYEEAKTLKQWASGFETRDRHKMIAIEVSWISSFAHCESPLDSHVFVFIVILELNTTQIYKIELGNHSFIMYTIKNAWICFYLFIPYLNRIPSDWLLCHLTLKLLGSPWLVCIRALQLN